jgi:phenylacetate-coenzyme A ligase PaaK-like adenylate-forming protein
MTKQLFFFSNFLLNRRNISSTYRSLMKTQWYSQDELLSLQFKKLQDVLSHSYEFIPFYKKRFDDLGMRPGDIKNFDDYKKIPSLKRQEIIDHHVDMLDVHFLESLKKINPDKQAPGKPRGLSFFSRHKLIMNTSSGSTGAPTVFYEDGTQTGLNWANELRIKSWFGADPGSKEVRFLRASREELSKNLIATFRRHVWSQLLLPGVNLREEDHARSYERIMEFKPKILWGFTSAISELAQYMIDHNLDIGNAAPNVAITWAAPLYDFEEKRIETAFKCKVTNIYGTREVGHIATRCPEGSMHINQESLYVENKEEESESGKEILCTSLVNVPMPFIKFETGDIGEMVEQKCSCGRHLKVINNLLGRTGEVIFDKDGKMIAPNVWCRFFMEGKLASRINRFQIHYMKNKDIEMKIEKGKNFNDETNELIKNKFYSQFSNDNMLIINYVDKIEPTKSGKYKMIINDLSETTQG